MNRCCDVYSDPVITSGCHHSFCAACIARSVALDPQCPLCRGRLRPPDLHPNLALAGLVAELPVRCAFADEGCTDILRLDAYQSHVAHCKFAPAKCEFAAFGCDFKGNVMTLASHIKSCQLHAMRSYIVSTEKRIHALEDTVQRQSLQIAQLLAVNASTDSEIETHVASTSQLTGSIDKFTSPISVAPATGSSSAIRIRSGSIGSTSHRQPRGLSQMQPPDDPWPNGDIACIQTIAGNRSGVTATVAVGMRIYTGAYDGKIRVFDVASGNLIDTTDAHTLSVWSLATDAANDRLFSAGTDGAIKIWSIDPTTGTLTFTNAINSSHGGKIYSLVRLANLLVSASSDHTIKLWNINTLACAGTCVGHTAGVNAICVLPNDRLASASSDASVKIWDIATTSVIHSISHLPSDTLDVTVGSGLLFASTMDANVTAFNLDDFSRVRVLSGHRWEVWKLAYTSGVLFSGSHDHTIKRWDLRRFQSTADLTGHKGYIHSLMVDQGCLVSGCADKTVKIWGTPR